MKPFLWRNSYSAEMKNRCHLAAAILAGLLTCFSATQTAGQVLGAVVRFTSNSTSVDVTIGEDNPTVRDFLSRLPLNMVLEEYAGREKIGYFKPKLDIEGSPGSDPKDGDVIYFVPWGNIGFYYNASGIDYSDLTIHLGTYKADLDQLKQLEGEVRVEVIQ
jgi:hypothetical protein